MVSAISNVSTPEAAAPAARPAAQPQPVADAQDTVSISHAGHQAAAAHDGDGDGH